jgi:hypothetical protein
MDAWAGGMLLSSVLTVNTPARTKLAAHNPKHHFLSFIIDPSLRRILPNSPRKAKGRLSTEKKMPAANDRLAC